jgi:hypothetical protein
MTFKDVQKFMEARYSSELAAVRNAMAYRIPKTHTRWETLSALIAWALPPVGDVAPADEGSKLHIYFWHRWYEGRFPMYCLSTNLLRQFEAADTAGLSHLITPEWTPPTSLFLLLLPQNAVTSPAGNHCPYILVGCCHPRIDSIIKGEFEIQLSIATSDDAEVTWVKGRGIQNGQIIAERKNLGSSAVEQPELIWLDTLFNIALQAILTLSFLPELVEAPQSERAGKSTILQPGWIGRDYDNQSDTTELLLRNRKVHLLWGGGTVGKSVAMAESIQQNIGDT